MNAKTPHHEAMEDAAETAKFIQNIVSILAFVFLLTCVQKNFQGEPLDALLFGAASFMGWLTALTAAAYRNRVSEALEAADS